MVEEAQQVNHTFDKQRFSWSIHLFTYAVELTFVGTCFCGKRNFGHDYNSVNVSTGSSMLGHPTVINHAVDRATLISVVFKVPPAFPHQSRVNLPHKLQVSTTKFDPSSVTWDDQLNNLRFMMISSLTLVEFHSIKISSQGRSIWLHRK